MVLYVLTSWDLIKNGNYQVIHNTHIAFHHVYHFPEALLFTTLLLGHSRSRTFSVCFFDISGAIS